MNLEKISKIKNSTQSKPSVIEKPNINSNFNRRNFNSNNKNLKYTDDDKHQ